MMTTWAGVVFVGSLILALVIVHRPLGDYMAAGAHHNARHLRAERVVVPRAAESSRMPSRAGAATCARCWPSARSRCCFLVRIPTPAARISVTRTPSRRMTGSQACNTAVSFVTNTNWQCYSGESALGYVAQMAGLAVQNFVSAAVGWPWLSRWCVASRGARPIESVTSGST